MFELREFHEPLLAHGLTPMGPIPSVCDPDGVYPYESYVETSRRPVIKQFQFVALENDFLRVTICPDLGGKVHSLFDKRSGHEVLFVPPSIQPARFLPRLGFVPGGIEVSFPISHTPVQLEPVAFRVEALDDRLYLWCGERELRFGMHWTVEYSLGIGDDFLTQRTGFRNPSLETHPWMSWSNAAVPARADSEFHFPGGPVLCHGESLKTIDWAAEGPRRVGDVRRMTGFFWLRPDAGVFGAFTPSLGHGLYHLADPALAPGIKLWTYGVGPHEDWGRVASLSGESYLELQGGPLRDQSIKENLAPGQQRFHVEFWRPSYEALDIHRLTLPRPDLIAPSEIPWFEWPPRPAVEFWRSVLAAHQARRSTLLLAPPEPDQNLWAPSGMDGLGEALGWAVSVTDGRSCDAWRWQLGAWLSAREQIDAALGVLEQSRDDRARVLAGRLHLRARNDPRAAVASFHAVHTDAIALHPQVMIERDLALAGLGNESLATREQWLDRIACCDDEWLCERRVALLVDQGRFQEARTVLEQTRFQWVHQRYARRALWQRIQEALRIETPNPPNQFGEDDLAPFGAYREFAGE